MRRSFLSAVCAALLVAAGAVAQQGIQQGKVKRIDVAGGKVTLGAAGGKDFEAAVTADTRFMDADGKPIADRLKDPRLKEGVAVMFKIGQKDGKPVLVGLKLAGKPTPIARADTSRLKPLTELGAEKYQGFEGGLYPGGKNERPAAHEAAGVALAAKVRPLDADGKPDPRGKIVLLSVGMSNTQQVFAAFKKLADADTDKDPRVVVVNGAQGGMTAAAIQDPASKSGAKYWAAVDERLRSAGVTRAQVQAVWIKQADAGPTQGFPKYAKTLQEELARIVQILPRRFPNVKLAYLSSRTYAGWATTRLNPEPYAYESGFSVRWLIEDQLKGDPALNYDPGKGQVRAPWLSWGPYLWANGSTKRADGFFYEEEDFSSDGTHPSAAGQRKVGRSLLQFFKTDPTARPWFTPLPASRKYKVQRTKYEVMGAAARRSDKIRSAERISLMRRAATGITLYFVLRTLYFERSEELRDISAPPPC
jgi:hypothetical protein